jgi:hypothetical protein
MLLPLRQRGHSPIPDRHKIYWPETLFIRSWKDTTAIDKMEGRFCMELVLTHLGETQINVTCNGQFSHIFNLSPLQSRIKKEFLDDPVYYSQEFDSALAAYGKQLYQALFPSNTLAQHTLAAESDRLLLVTTDNDLDTIPWCDLTAVLSSSVTHILSSSRLVKPVHCYV